ncbi:3-isopropylmalate dehydratase large subunit [Helicobacter pametensis]|nr:3-isopropylmalate dehydratase large subunit [Helicobacter pametensis]
MTLGVNGKVPNPADKADAVKRAGMEHALEYMGLAAGTPLNGIPVDVVFIGSCTNSRTEDLREAAAVAKGRKKADNVNRVLVMPGYGLVKEQAEVEGLDKILTDTGFE